MRILIIGEYFSTNLGDGVICRTVEYLLNEIQLQEKTPEFQLNHWDISLWENYDVSIAYVQNKYTKLLVRILNKCKGGFVKKYCRYLKQKDTIIQQCFINKTDVVIFAGGQLFMDYFAFSIYRIVKEYSKTKTLIYFNACGTYTKNNFFFNFLFRRIFKFKNVRKVTTRSSYPNCRKIISFEKYTRVPDPAIFAAEAFKVTRNPQSDTIGLGIMEAGAKNEKKLNDFWVKIIKALNEKKIKWKAFCNGNYGDYKLAKMVLLNCGYPEEELSKLLTDRPEKPHQLIEIISQFKTILAFRLHSLIIAYSLKVPFIGLIWDDKLMEFAEIIGHADRVISWENADIDTIIGKILSEENSNISYEVQNSLKNEIRTSLQEIIEDVTVKNVPIPLQDLFSSQQIVER